MSLISDKNNNINCSIVKWALPREEIPISINISKNLDFDRVIIKIPSNFEFIDFINVASVDVKKDYAEINKIITTKIEDTPLYFGFVVSSKNIPKTLKDSNKIKIELIHNEKIIESEILEARIFRPQLELINVESEINLEGDAENYEIPMDIKYTGFGDIKLKIESKIEDEIKGNIISENETIVSELIKRIIRQNHDEVNNTKNKNQELYLQDEFIQELTQKIVLKISNGDLSNLYGFDINDLSSLKKIVDDVNEKNKFLDVVYTHVEDIFISLLSELLESHPTDNVKLSKSQTNIKISIESHITSITTFLYYKDSIGNKYSPIEIPMKIIDNRDNKSKHKITMPIRIKKFEEDPFINVADMNI